MDTTADQAHAVPISEKGRALEVLGVATRLGLTSLADRSPTSVISTLNMWPAADG